MINQSEGHSEANRRATYGHMVRGSAWMILMRLAVRSIGFVSTIILARLLVPEDFGIVAMAMIIYGLLLNLSDFGVGSFLIQRSDATRGHYDTAWTVKILQYAVISLVMVLASPWVAEFFDEPRVEYAMMVLALAPLIGGFENIGIIDFRKNLHFAKDFRFNLYQNGLQFIVTITLAILFQSYWALVFGMVCARTIGVILSYTMHPYRPRFSLSEIREMWGFSQWMLVLHLARYLRGRTALAIAGSVAGTGMMGTYHMSQTISTTVTSELASPIARALFPNYAKIKHDLTLLRDVFLTVQGALATLCLPIGFGLSAVSEDAVAVLLGGNWTEAAPLIQWLAISGAVAFLGSGHFSILVSLGRVRRVAAIAILNLFILVPPLLAAGLYWSVEGLAITRLVVGVIMMPIVYWSICSIIQLPLTKIVVALWRPCIASMVMFVAVKTLHMDTLEMPALTLVIDVGVGVLAYVLSLAALWFVAGRPEGIERQVVRYMATRFGHPREA